MLEGSLKLRLNMDKTKITHVNDSFIFLGHRIIRKRSRYGEMQEWSQRSRRKSQKLRRIADSTGIRQLVKDKVDMAEQLNRN